MTSALLVATFQLGALGWGLLMLLSRVHSWDFPFLVCVSFAALCQLAAFTTSRLP